MAQWDHQATIERLVRSLQKRGYLVWFDLDCMKVRFEFLIELLFGLTFGETLGEGLDDGRK